jgi:phosphate-selective porin OprO/OprP
MNTRTLVKLTLAVPTALCGGEAFALSMEERMELMESRMKQMEAQLEKSQEENTQLKKRLAAKPGAAADTAPLAAAGKEDVATLSDKVVLLERKIDQDKKAATEAAKTAPKLEVGQNGVTFKSADENYRLRLGGYVQADARFFADNTTLDSNTPATGAVNDQFLIRRARLTIDGTFYKWADFRLSPDFAGSTLRLFDAFADLHYFDYAALMAGKMRVPISLERYQTAPNLTFIERAYPAEIAPNRDVGLMLHGQFGYPGYKTQYGVQPTFKDFFSYEVGVFNGTRDNQAVQNSDSDKDNNKEVAARIFSHPFLHSGSGNSALEGLGIGVAGTWGRPKYNNMPSLVSVGQNNIVTYVGGTANSLALGDSYRLYPQMYWYFGPFGLMGEYALSSQQLQGSYIQSGKAKTASTRAQNDA